MTEPQRIKGFGKAFIHKILVIIQKRKGREMRKKNMLFYENKKGLMKYIP